MRILLNGFLFGAKVPNFDYSAIRPYGAPINGFGGTSSGHGPLKELHESLIDLYTERIGQAITSVDIVDTENLIGRCVVAGNVRRSAALALGNHDDFEYLQMKNDSEKLAHHRWGSNNSFHAIVGQDYTWHAEQSQNNGEPGYIWLDNARTRGRFADPPRDDDKNVMGFNPCVEQQLEDAELCCLVETFPAKHETYDDYLATLKIAYLYGKTVTLANTHWAETNAKMLKNRRIGLSQSGVVQAFNKFGRRQMLNWCDEAYEYVRELDKQYSDWLCIPQSVRMTSIKPSGTVSLLNGSTPGIHYPEDEYYIRRIRFAADSDMLPALEAAGYKKERGIATWRIIGSLGGGETLDSEPQQSGQSADARANRQTDLSSCGGAQGSSECFRRQHQGHETGRAARTLRVAPVRGRAVSPCQHRPARCP